MKNKLLQGDALTKLKELKEKSVDMCMTSPPYWALRDYGDGNEQIWDEVKDCEHEWRTHKTPPRGGHSHPDRLPKVGANKDEMTKGTSARFGYESNFCNKCGAWKGQLGLEPTFNLYIKHLCDIFDGVKRVLRDEGTCWVNIGDSYVGGGSGNYGSGLSSKQGNSHETNVKNKPKFLKENKLQAKCLASIPSRFQIEMINRGWILRNVIIWYKPNCLPESVKDRFTRDFEYIFLFSKKKEYYFKQQFEPHQSNSIKRRGAGFNESQDFDYSKRPKDDKFKKYSLRAKRGGDKSPDVYNPEGRNKRTTWKISPKPFKEAHFAVYPEELCETPIKAGCPEGGTVLDPFFGAGTTGVVALKQRKNIIGIEINPEYIEIAKKRLKPYLEQKKLA